MLPWYHPNRALRLTHRYCKSIPHGCNAPTRLHLLTANRFRTATRGSFSQELLYRALTCRSSLCHTAPATRPVIVFWDLLELLYYIRLCAFCQEKFTNRRNARRPHDFTVFFHIRFKAARIRTKPYTPATSFSKIKPAGLPKHLPQANISHRRSRYFICAAYFTRRDASDFIAQS